MCKDNLSGITLARLHLKCTTKQKSWIYGEMILRWEKYKKYKNSHSLKSKFFNQLSEAPEDIKIMIIADIIGPFQ
ncbi:MAG: hypothetical protein QMD86_02415 [Patescibacteria group bacterium]|nr:hypothetical protein [Patescibacteria group bacterium]